MKALSAAARSWLIFGIIACGPTDEPEAAPPQLDRTDELLVFSKTAGFRHSSIEAAVPAITALAEEHGVTAFATEDEAFFTDEALARFDAVVFVSTTGPVLGPEQQAAFERYIQSGGGYVGIHAGRVARGNRTPGLPQIRT